MKLWDDDMEKARPTIRAESREFVERMQSPEPATGSLEDRVRARRDAESAWVLRSDNGNDRTISGPAGELLLREFRQEKVEGAMLHIHGGGWMTGGREMMDPLNDAMSKALNLAMVSVDYRLSPENPYPAGPDDCEAAALWLIDNAAAEYGTDRLLIGGESAGGHLSAVTLLRLRDRHRAADRFCGANLVFGAYDLSFPPSATGIGLEPGTDLLDPESMRFMVEQFAPGMTPVREAHTGPVAVVRRPVRPAAGAVHRRDRRPSDRRLTVFRSQVGDRRIRGRAARLSGCAPWLHRRADRHEPLVAQAPCLLTVVPRRMR